MVDRCSVRAWSRALWLASVDGRDVEVIAHRFGFALEHGLEELLAVPLLGHRCDNPLCQLIAPRHVVRSSPSKNRRELGDRRRLAGGALADRRGARGRAREVRDAIRAGGDALDLVAASGFGQDGVQLALWADEGE